MMESFLGVAVGIILTWPGVRRVTASTYEDSGYLDIGFGDIKMIRWAISRSELEVARNPMLLLTHVRTTIFQDAGVPEN